MRVKGARISRTEGGEKPDPDPERSFGGEGSWEPMAVRQLGNGWQCDFYAYGGRIRKVFEKKKDAVAYEGKLKAAIKENRYFDIKQEAFQFFKELSKWYLSLEDVKRKKSFERDERTVKNRLDPHFGKIPVKNITPSLINEYVSHRLNTRTYRKQNVRPATINRELALLKTMFNKAIQDGKLEKNPLKGVKHLKENNERERVLSPQNGKNTRQIVRPGISRSR